MAAIETKCGMRAVGKLGQRGRQKVSDQGISALSNLRRFPIGQVWPLALAIRVHKSANAASRRDVKSASTQ